MTSIIEPRTTNHAIIVSVVIASYNGVKYISEQLDSIRKQTRIPDEVIIADDCSSDGTFDFCEKFIAEHKLQGWTVYRNPQNLGISKNFRAAMAKCSGDYVFTCDQDDKWMPDKIEVMLQALQNNPQILLLTSNYIAIIDGKPAKIPLKNLERNDGEIIQFRLRDSGLTTLRPGCTVCFRRELLDSFNVFDIPESWHDSMLWIYAILRDGLFMINRQLIYYIRRETSQLGRLLPSRASIERRIEETFEAEDLYEKFLNASEGLKVPSANQKFLAAMIKFFQRRRNMLKKRNLFKTVIFVVFNFKYYPTARNALSDIYAMMFLK